MTEQTTESGYESEQIASPMPRSGRSPCDFEHAGAITPRAADLRVFGRGGRGPRSRTLCGKPLNRHGAPTPPGPRGQIFATGHSAA